MTESRLVVLGLSHKTAPVEVRERIALSQEAVGPFLREFKSRGLGREAFLLSTCNRVELYAVPNAETEEIERFLAEAGGVHARSLEPHLYRATEKDALRHLFRVTSSLDSMIVGEPQITGQVREAYRVAQASQATGPVLHRALDRALFVAKRVRNETGIGRESVSVGRAGVDLVKQVLGGLEGRSALLVGAGAHGKLVAKALLDGGLSELCVTNRTFERAVVLASRFGGAAVPFEDFLRVVQRVDVVLTSTGAGQILLGRPALQPVMKSRRYRSLVLMDLSVPRNVSVDVNELEGVFRFDVDDLDQVADLGRAKRTEAAQQAEQLVHDEAEASWKGLQNDSLHLRIGAASRWAEAMRLKELERSKALIEALTPTQREAIDALSKAMVKRLLHEPFKAARAHAEHGDQAAVDTLLSLWPPPEEEP